MRASHSNNAVKVIGMCGSLRKGSYSRKALRIALQGAKSVGAEIQLVDLREYNLNFCDGNKDESNYHSDVVKLRNEVKEAQGIILSTPEYHASFSGVLKNALDLMGFKEFEGKMLGLIGVSGGSMGAIDAINSLRTVGRALHAWVIPEQATIPAAYQAFDDSDNLIDPNLEQRVTEVGRQVARFSYLHSSEEAQEFINLWEEAPENPGGTDR